MIVTDYPAARQQAFYVEPESPVPERGTLIEYGDHRAWYDGHEVRKIEYNFDPAERWH